MVAHSVGHSQILDSMGVDCIAARYQEKGVDIDSVLNVYEDYLIGEGFLSKRDEDRYTHYFRRMVSENDFVGFVPQEIFNEISKVEIGKHMDRDCFVGFNDIDEIDWKTLLSAGKLYLLGKHHSEITDIGNAPREMGTFYLDHFSEEEMQAPFMRITLLLTIAWTTDLNRYFKPLLPPIKG